MTAEYARPAGVSIARLTLTAFRNHADLTLETEGAPFVGLFGPNGAGKTNILEALSLFAAGRSLRGAALEEIGRIDDPRSWAAFAEIADPHAPIRLGVAMERSDSGANRRVLRLDGAPARPADLADRMDLFWLTPAMDRLFAEAPSSRRRFLDRLTHGLDPGHAARVSAYEKAMRERARLLREGRTDAAWLGALEARMVEAAAAIAAARRDWATAITQIQTEAPPDPFPSAPLAVIGWLEDRLADQPALAVEEAYGAALAANRRADGDTPGPHRSDLLARHGGTDAPAERCSTGEQKAIVLSIALTQTRLACQRRGRAPLLLLDEAAAHMDSGRRDAFFSALAALGAQCWISATESAVLGGLGRDAALFEIAPGMAQRVE